MVPQIRERRGRVSLVHWLRYISFHLPRHISREYPDRMEAPMRETEPLEILYRVEMLLISRLEGEGARVEAGEAKLNTEMS